MPGITESSDPGSHHPCFVSPAAWWGEVSPKIPLPTPLSPSPAMQHPLHHQQPQSQSRNGIFALRGSAGISPSDSMAWTAPAGAGNKSPLSCPVLQVFQDYINLRVLCFLPGRLCVQGRRLQPFGVIYVHGFGVIRGTGGDRATWKWLWVKMQLQAGETGEILKHTSHCECEYCAQPHSEWALVRLAPAKPAVVQSPVRLLPFKLTLGAFCCLLWNARPVGGK